MNLTLDPSPQITYHQLIILSMAMMMEVNEDDVFFADLNRRISLLITDEEDGDDVYYSHSISYPTSVSIQGFTRTSMFPTTQTQHHFHYYDQMNYKNSTTTTDQSKGTGVFIPKSSQWNRSRTSKHHQPTKTTNYNNYNSYNNNNFRHYHHQQHRLPNQTVFSQVIFGSKKC